MFQTSSALHISAFLGLVYVPHTCLQLTLVMFDALIVLLHCLERR